MNLASIADPERDVQGLMGAALVDRSRRRRSPDRHRQADELFGERRDGVMRVAITL